MSRTSRVPYHQNVYDLLGIEPGEDPEAARMIADHEATHGPLPASVREWYLVPKVVLPTWTHRSWQQVSDTIWFDPRDFYQAFPLDRILLQCTDRAQNLVWFMDEHQGVTNWMIELDESDDPAVWRDEHGLMQRPQCVLESATLSVFLWDWFAPLYRNVSWIPPSLREPGRRGTSRTHSVKPYRNGLWLRSPDEPFAVPIIDFLTEQLGEPKRTPRSGDVATYTYRPEGGTVRVTADHPAHPDPLSAWWVHADTADRLAEFAQLLLPWGTLRDTLRADTDPARDVWTRVRGA